jgi:hypothetical protein
MAGLRPARLTQHYPLKAVVGLRPATAFGVSGVTGRISAGRWLGSPVPTPRLESRCVTNDS